MFHLLVATLQNKKISQTSDVATLGWIENQILYHKNCNTVPTLRAFGIVFNYVGIIHANKPLSKPQHISKVSGNYYYYDYGMKMNSPRFKNKH